MTDSAIQTENLTCSFLNGVCALKDLSLEVPQGNIFGFLGSNGSGKTTTIHLLLGLLKATSGRAKVLGFDICTQATEIRDRTGVLLEHTGLYERLSAEDNLEFYGRIYRLPTNERRSRIKELLGYMGLWERRHDQIGKWSRGMKQKLAVARALLHRPPLVFLDEPTAGLDPMAASALGDLLLELVAKEGVTVFITTHHLAEAEKLCDRVGILKEGKLLATGAINELKQQSASERVKFTGNNFNKLTKQLLLSQSMVSNVQIHQDCLLVDLQSNSEITPLVKLLVDRGSQIETIQRESSSLHEIFLRLMTENK
jgi:ABC-2 type transport system ATP-binding protein